MPSFAEALYNLPTERLRALVERRSLDTRKMGSIPNKKQLAQFLSTELSKPASTSEAITQCNARELRLLQLLLGAEGEQTIAWDRLLAIAGDGQGLSEALDKVMTRLEDLGLAFRVVSKAGAKGVFMPNATRQFVPASLSDRYTLERCLEQYDAVSLKRICDALGLPQETKMVNVKAVKTHLLEPGAVTRLKRPLNEDEIAVLEYLVQSGGAATAIEAATAALQSQSEDFFRYDWQNRWKQGKSRNAIDTLLERGLLYVVSYGYGYNLFLLIPGDLLRALSGGGDIAFWTSPPLAPVLLPAPPARAVRHTALLRDVVAMLGYMSAQDAVRTNTGHIHKTNLKNLMRGLSLPEERYAGFLYAVCREAGLIATQTERQVYKITTSGNSWLHWDSLAQTRALVDAWRKGALWGEMYNDPLHKSNEYRSKETVLRMREAALYIIIDEGKEKKKEGTGDKGQGENETEAGEAEQPYYDIASITDTLMYRFPLLLASSANAGGDIVPSPANFIRLLIGECLYWLGLAELAEPPDAPASANSLVPAGAGARTAAREELALSGRGAGSQKPGLPDAIGFRLTPSGAYLLGGSDTRPPASDPREDQFIVQANGEIFVSPYLEPATLYHLLAMTDTPAKGATGNTVMLTRDSIRRCLDQGEQPRDVLAFLQAHARTGIPQNVEYLINDVGGKHGNIRLGKAQMYVQVDTPLLLKELQARKEIKPYFVRNLSDTVAILNSDDADKLMRELRKAGYLPVSDDDKPQSALNLKVKPAPPPAPLREQTLETSGPKKRRAADLIDWNRMAQEDAKPYEAGGEAPSGGMVTNITRNQTLIKTLLVQACKMHNIVEIEYLEQGSPHATRREIEPERITGNFLAAYDRSTGADTNFNITRIQWVRLTGENFDA